MYTAGAMTKCETKLSPPHASFSPNQQSKRKLPDVATQCRALHPRQIEDDGNFHALFLRFGTRRAVSTYADPHPSLRNHI